MIRRFENSNNRRLQPNRSPARNPITMEGEFSNDFVYQRNLTTSPLRDCRRLYNKPDYVSFWKYLYKFIHNISFLIIKE